MQQEEDFMREALLLAANARGRTAPNPLVGAVIVREGRIVGAGWHRKAGTPHAEVHALAMAGDLAHGATAYVTLEPCMMCLGAMLHARISRVVFGAPDPKTGVCGGVLDLPAEGRLNHQTVVQGGLLADECGKLLQRFFAERRAQRRADRAALRAQQDELARWAASLPAEEETGTLHLDEAGD